jgi:hypothetical protein
LVISDSEQSLISDKNVLHELKMKLQGAFERIENLENASVIP